MNRLKCGMPRIKKPNGKNNQQKRQHQRFSCRNYVAVMNIVCIEMVGKIYQNTMKTRNFHFTRLEIVFVLHFSCFFSRAIQWSFCSLAEGERLFFSRSLRSSTSIRSVDYLKLFWFHAWLASMLFLVFFFSFVCSFFLNSWPIYNLIMRTNQAISAIRCYIEKSN